LTSISRAASSGSLRRSVSWRVYPALLTITSGTAPVPVSDASAASI
jgi:hypothetical protein